MRLAAGDARVTEVAGDFPISLIRERLPGAEAALAHTGGCTEIFMLIGEVYGRRRSTG